MASPGSSSPRGPRARWSDAGTVVGAGLVAALAVAPVLAVIGALGHNIPTPDAASDYVKGVLWALAISATIPLWPVQRAERRLLAALWGLRCLTTLGLMLPYEAHYGLDAYMYFDASQQDHFDWTVLKATNSGTGVMQLLTWLHARYLVSSYHAMKVTSSLLGLIAVWLIYRAACRIQGHRMPRLLIALGCFPSILFWSSILGKDPIVLLGISLNVFGVLAWMSGGTALWLFPALVGVGIAGAIRLWLVPILVLPAVVAGIRRQRDPAARIGLIVVATVLLSSATIAMRDKFAVAALSDTLEVLNQRTQSFATGGSAQKLATGISSTGAFLRFLPLGMFTALLRPLPGEILNPFGLLSGLENFAVLCLMGLAAWRTRWRDLRPPVMTWAITYVIVWAALYAPFSYQNLGTAARFRLQVLPIFLTLLFHLARRREPSVPNG